MLKGFLQDLLGPDDGGAATADFSRPSPLPEALAAKLALDEAPRHPEIAARAVAFLDEQARVLRMQADGLAEEHPLRLLHLRCLAHESQLRRVGHRLKIVTQATTALVFAGVGVVAALWLYQAVNSRSVIVEAFDSPDSLGAKGLTGKVLAERVLDNLTQLQTATHGVAGKRDLSSAWSRDIKISVPQAGISIADIDHMLRVRLGHDTHINGDLVQTSTGGLALSVRGDGVAPKVFTGGSQDLERMAMQAAEYIYGQAEPALYAGYLVETGRASEAVSLSKAAFDRTSAADRPRLLNGWANAVLDAGGSAADALLLYRQAIRLDPNYWTAYANVMNVDLILGNEEQAWADGQALTKAAHGRPGRSPETHFQNLDQLTWNLQAWRMALYQSSRANGGAGALILSETPLLAAIDVRLHDEASARFLLQTARNDAWDPSLGALTHFVRGRLAMEDGDISTAVREMEVFAKDFAKPAVSSNFAGYNCWLAPIEEAAGRRAQADEALRKGGHFVDCYRFRGDILDDRGDWIGAQRAYADAVALAPDLPAAYYSWGLALARHGDLNGAIARLAAAHARGPHWADPLKAWGDILARQARWREAADRYGLALGFAPAWSGLIQAQREAALHVK